MWLYFPLTMEFQLIVLSVEAVIAVVVGVVDADGVLMKWTAPKYQIKMSVIRATPQTSHRSLSDSNSHWR